jgi:hypothetical protein
MLIVVRAPRHKLLFLVVLCALAVAASAWLALSHAAPPLTEVAGWMGLLFSGLCGGWWLSKLFSHRVSLIVDRIGLVDNSSGTPAGRIAWEEITRVGITTVVNQRFLGIDVRDQSRLVSSSSAFRRWIDQANKGITEYYVNIPSATVDRTLEELHDLIARYWKDPTARTELDLYDPAAGTS